MQKTIADHTPSIYDSVAESLLCFDCRGRLVWNGSQMECRACNSFFPVHNYLIYRGADFKDAYGEWFKQGASSYDEEHNLNSDWSNFFGSITVKTLNRYTKLPARLALEIGCGTGAHTRGYLAHGLAENILATDISAEMLAQAANKTDCERAIFCLQDVHDLTIAPGSIDVVAGASILHHLADLPTCLRQISKVLTPGGVAIFLEPFFVGHRMQAYALRFALAEFAAATPNPPEELGLLRKMAASYAGSLEYCHHNRHTPEVLAAQDDKHLFIREELRPLALAAGFETVVFEGLYDVVPSGRETVIRDVVIDIASSLLKEAHFEGPPPDLRTGGFLDDFSRFYAEFFMTDFSPQEFCVFVNA